MDIRNYLIYLKKKKDLIYLQIDYKSKVYRFVFKIFICFN